MDAAVIDDTPRPVDAWTNNALWNAANGLPQQACAPWSLDDTANPEAPVLVGSALTISTDADAERMSYSHDGNALVVPTGTFVMEARVRFITGAAMRANWSAVWFGFDLGGKGISVFLLDGMIVLDNYPSTSPTHAAATADGFHDYRLEADVATNAASLFRDNTMILTGTLNDRSGFSNSIGFGDSTGIAYGTSEWSRVTHNAHALGPCP